MKDDDLAEVNITRDNVYFNGTPLPPHIAKNGVTLKPGREDDFNTLIVEFFVGQVFVEDPDLYRQVAGEDL